MGILGHLQNSCTLVNRTQGAGKFERVLNVRYDGEDYDLQPGENPNVPIIVAQYAKQQNILMGSRHPSNPTRVISLVGIKGKDDCAPIDEATMEVASHKLEGIDRSGEFWGDEMAPRQLLRKRGFDAFEAASALPSEYAVNRNVE